MSIYGGNVPFKPVVRAGAAFYRWQLNANVIFIASLQSIRTGRIVLSRTVKIIVDRFVFIITWQTYTGCVQCHCFVMKYYCLNVFLLKYEFSSFPGSLSTVTFMTYFIRYLAFSMKFYVEFYFLSSFCAVVSR